MTRLRVEGSAEAFSFTAWLVAGCALFRGEARPEAVIKLGRVAVDVAVDTHNIVQ